MKKTLALLLIFVLALSISACRTDSLSENKDSNSASDSETFVTNENAELFFDKVIENKRRIDPIFSSVCSAWKSEEIKSGATVSDVNKAISEVLKQHSDNLTAIDETDKNIAELYELAKKCPASTNIEQVMASYVAYEESVLNADASTNPGGYNDASAAKNSLDKALRNLRNVLDS